jgi:hypothetical protein
MSYPNMVTWSDYDGVEGFGNPASREEVDDLVKALNVGQDRDPPASVVAGDGFSMRVESLESTMRNLTFRMEHLTFFKALTKLPEYNTVAEYNVLHSYGENEDDGWIDEGELPNEDSSSYERKHAFVKYIGTTRSVSHVATVIKPAHGALVGQETVNGTMKLLRVLEKALFKADTNLSALQFDGYERLMLDGAPAANIIDMRGKPLTEDVLIDAALTVSDAPNYGLPTDLYCAPKVKADLLKTFFPKERYDLFTKRNDGLVGLDLSGYMSPAGPVKFQQNVFISDGGGVPAAAVGDPAKIPSTPTVSTAATTPADGASQFADEDAGDYFYSIVAVNRYGHSAAVPLVAGPTAVTVAAGDKVLWGMTPAGSIRPDYYRVYRTKVGGASGTERLIMRVPNAAVALAEQLINDYNAYLPYCTSAYLFQMNRDNMAWKQLAPMVRIPLATIDTSVRWAQVCYGVPVLYSPQKNVLFINIGRALGYAGQP